MLIGDCRRNLILSSRRSRRISHITRSAGVGDARRICARDFTVRTGIGPLRAFLSITAIFIENRAGRATPLTKVPPLQEGEGGPGGGASEGRTLRIPRRRRHWHLPRP